MASNLNLAAKGLNSWNISTAPNRYINYSKSFKGEAYEDILVACLTSKILSFPFQAIIKVT